MNIKDLYHKKRNLFILIVISILFYGYWIIDKIQNGINTKTSLLDRLASMILFIIAFFFTLYWGRILLKKSYNKWPNQTIIITIILAAIFIIWAIIVGDSESGGGYWGTYQHDTHF